MTANQTLEMKIQRVDAIEGCVVIRPKGGIDAYNTEAFRKQVLKVVEEGSSRLVFDCAEVPYMSSAAVGTCTIFLKQVKTRRGSMAMANLQPRVREVIQLLGFTNYLNVVDTLEDALVFVAPASGAAALFPLIFDCPACGRRLKAGKSGLFRCSECKTAVRVDEAGRVQTGYAQEDNDFDLVPVKTEQAIRLLGDLSKLVRQGPLGPEEKTSFKRMIGQIVLNLYQREVKDVWAELEEIATGSALSR